MMNNKELIGFLAYVHDQVEAAKREATPATVAAIVAVEAVLDEVLGNPGNLLHPSTEYMFVLRMFAGTCPDTQYPLPLAA